MMNLFSMLNLHVTAQQGWELIAWTMCYFLAAGTAVALLGALIRFASRRAAPHLRYTVSLSVFALLATMPIVLAAWFVDSIPAETQAVASTSTVLSDTAAASRAVAPLDFEANTRVIPTKQSPLTTEITGAPRLAAAPAHQDGGASWVIEILPWVWLVGTPLTFLLLTTGLVGSQRLCRQSKLLTAGPLYETCQRLRQSLAVSQHVAVAIHDRITTPLLVGVVRPLILLPPAALSGWSPDEIEMVLLHELAHVRRWDNLVNFLQRIVESLLFFHPCVWWVSHWVRQDREECCDAIVVRRTAQPQAYAELLLNLATPTSPLAGLAMAQHPLASRIRRILKLEDEKMLVTRSTLGWLGFALFALLTAAAWQPTTPSVAEEKPGNITSAKTVSEQKAPLIVDETGSVGNRTPRVVEAEQTRSGNDVLRPTQYPTDESTP
ncbi:MAG: M56 family metallopeptidase, partial [Bythopirellula sp.]